MSVGPFLTSAKAAEYCGYSARRFRTLSREYCIPKYGPHQNRFCVADLDEFMKSPSTFLDGETEKTRTPLKLEV